VEVFNGSWLHQKYVTVAEQLASSLGVARTGGSDAHDPALLMTCYTELPDPIRSTADVVHALRRGLTIPHRRRMPAQRKRFGLF
jgi:hypothetical protein